MKRLVNKPVSSASRSPQKNSRFSGQGMVEFALALPILLMVVYGLIESGRLIFIYSSAVTAARQAARYGSTTGNNDGGTPYYRDCDGIRDAVQNTGFLNRFNDDDIFITYDRGLDNAGNVVAIPGINSDPATDTCGSMTDTILQNGDRIKVQVSTDWAPILSLIPSFRGFTITTAAERTILVTVPIGVDPEAEIWVPGGALQLTVSSPVTSFNGPNQIITYNYFLYNNANFPLNAPFTVADNIASESCSGIPSTLAPGASYTCTGTYTTTQADVDAGFITDLAIASSIETSSNQTGITIPAIQTQSLTLTKTPSTTIAVTPGIVVTYTYKLENTGNVTLSGPYTVTDNKIPAGQIDCSGAAATIAPGAYTQCTGTYTITATDISNASVTNTATAKAFFKEYEVTSNIATAKVNTAPLDLTVAATPTTVTTLNQKITYLYTLTNVGAAPLNAPYSIVDDRAVNISCSSSSQLAPGASTTCTGEYYVTQANLDAGTDLINIAYATSDGGAVKSSTASATVTISSAPAITLAITTSPLGTITVGTVINYQYVITNSGNATLNAPYSITEINVPITPTCASSSPLTPGSSTTCTASYTVKQSDIDKGSIVSLAIAKAMFGTQEISSAQATTTVITYVGARVTLLLSSTPNGYSTTGTALSIKFTIRNSGSITLTSPYTISTNGFLGTVTCSGSTSPLLPSQETTCATVTYTTTSTDINTGSVTITGTVSAKNGAATVTSSSATLIIPSSFVCSATAGLINFPRTNQMAVNITNNLTSSGSISLKIINLANWNFSSHAQQYISSISFGGVQIYTGSNANRVDPVNLSAPFSGNVTLAPGQTKELLFAFNKNYNATNNEIITITFSEYGCPTLTATD